MKQIKYLLMAFIALFTCISFSACSDDDEGGGSSKNGSAFSTLDGRTVKYKYLYVVSEVDEYEGDTFYGLFASTEDLFYYRQHPEKVKDDMVYSYMSLDMYENELNKPQHQFDVEVGYDSNLKEAITDDEDDSDTDFPVASTYIWYTTPWDQDESSTETLTVKKSGNTFKVETTELTFLASEMGTDDGIDDYSRKTKGKIAFESSNLISAVQDSPEVVFVKSAKDRKFLKSLRARRK